MSWVLGEVRAGPVYVDRLKMDPLRNPKDPLRHYDVGERELFRQLVAVCLRGGATRECVNVAAVNLIINSLRQEYGSKEEASRAFDELFASGKKVLLDNHYDSTGRKRGIFPYDQVIRVDATLTE